MPGKRCQVCDGPVVNGRCKLCGMPYRNDEVLYHLNENRRDHYRHATTTARKIMRSQQTASGSGRADAGQGASSRGGQAGSVKKPAGSRAASTQSKSLASRRKEPEKKRAQNAAGSTRPAAGSTRPAAGSARPAAEKKTGKGKLTGALVVFIVLLSLAGVIPGVISMVRSIVVEEALDGTNTYWPETNEPSRKFENMVNGTDYDYALGCNYGYVWVGSEIDPGTYRVFVTEGSAVFTVEDLEGKIREYRADAGESYSYTESTAGVDAHVTLMDGDTVCVTEAEEGTEQIFFQRVEAL